MYDDHEYPEECCTCDECMADGSAMFTAMEELADDGTELVGIVQNGWLVVLVHTCEGQLQVDGLCAPVTRL